MLRRLAGFTRISCALVKCRAAAGVALLSLIFSHHGFFVIATKGLVATLAINKSLRAASPRFLELTWKRRQICRQVREIRTHTHTRDVLTPQFYDRKTHAIFTARFGYLLCFIAQNLARKAYVYEWDGTNFNKPLQNFNF
jgi:hypothetical protein